MRDSLTHNLLVTLLATPALGQTVWNVAAGAPVQPVVDGASPGDIVVLAPGVYEKFDLDKGLTIVGPATIGTTTQPNDLTIDVPPGQMARLVDLTVAADQPLNQLSAGITRIHGGVVSLEGCTFSAALTSTSAVEVIEADVVFDHCIVDGTGNGAFGPAALNATDANIAATDSQFLGPNGAFFTSPGRGITIHGSTGSLHLSHCTVTGGNAGGIVAEAPPQPAIVTGVPTWITNSVITGGNGGFAFTGAVGLFALVPTEVARSTITGGPGFATGQPTSGPVTTNPALLGVRSTDPTTAGSPLTLTYTADQPGIGVTVLGTAGDLIPPLMISPLQQPLWASSLFVASALSTDASGEAALVLTVPNDTALVYRAFDFTGARIAGSGVQLSPVVPVTVR